MKKRIEAFIENTGGIRLAFLLIAFTVLPTLFASTILYTFQDKSEWLLSGNLFSFLAFYGIATFTMSFALIPTTAIAILSGYFFGWWGFVGVMFCYLVACYAGLFFGKIIYHYFVGERLFENKKVQGLLARLHEEEFLLIFFGRLSPIFTFAMMNIVFAALQPKMKKYLLASVMGAMPRILLFFYLGKSVDEIWSFVNRPTLEGSLALFPVALVVVSLAGIIWVMRRVMNKNITQ